MHMYLCTHILRHPICIYIYICTFMNRCIDTYFFLHEKNRSRIKTWGKLETSCKWMRCQRKARRENLHPLWMTSCRKRKHNVL